VDRRPVPEDDRRAEPRDGLKDLPLRSVRMNRIAEADVARLNAAMPDCSFVRWER
jgi:hypothetical protein